MEYDLYGNSNMLQHEEYHERLKKFSETDKMAALIVFLFHRSIQFLLLSLSVISLVADVMH